MFVVMGANGQTGGAVARLLLDQGQPVRVVLRPGRDGQEWQRRGAEVAHAEATDAAALTSAFTGARAVYALLPPDYASEDMVVRARAVTEAYATALRATGARAVALSSFGSQHAEGTGNILTTHVLEQGLGPLGAGFVRPGSFMTNWLPVLPAMREGVLPSLFSPLDRPLPHTAVQDIAATVVRELHRDDARTVELAAPADYAPNDVAAAFATALGRPVTARVLTPEERRSVLAGMGMSPGAIRSWEEMLAGITSGHIRYEGTPERGQTSLESFAKSAVAASPPPR